MYFITILLINFLMGFLKILLVCTLLGWFPSQPNSFDKNPRLKLSISNISTIDGYINIGIFNSNTDFLKKGKAFRNFSIKVTKSVESIVIDDLPKGNYAISLYHDKNSDGICNLNLLGIPKEPYGFSNNFKPRFSAPVFDDCKFVFHKDLNLTIRLSK